MILYNKKTLENLNAWDLEPDLLGIILSLLRETLGQLLNLFEFQFLHL